MGGFLDKVTPFPPAGTRVKIDDEKSDEKWKRKQMDFLLNFSPIKILVFFLTLLAPTRVTWKNTNFGTRIGKCSAHSFRSIAFPENFSEEHYKFTIFLSDIINFCFFLWAIQKKQTTALITKTSRNLL
jgi:hypothetical protein